MSVLKSLMKNTAARSFTELLNRFGSAAFWVIAVRELGAAGMGALTFSISLFSLFLTLSTLGLGAVVIRDVAGTKSNGGTYFGLTLILGSGSAILFAAVMVGGAFLLNISAQSIHAAMIMAVAMVPAAWFIWSKAILTAHEQCEKVAAARTVEFLIKIGLGILLLAKGYGVLAVVSAVALSKIISGVVIFVCAAKTVQPRFSFDWKVAANLVKQAPTFSAITFFNSLYWNLPVIVITFFGGEYQAGLFSAAFKLVDVLLSFAAAYGQALFPIASKTVKMNVGRFSVIIKKSIKYIGVLGLAVAAGGSMTALKLIDLIYGADMLPAVQVFRVLIWIVLSHSLIPIFAFSLLSSNLQKHDLRANIAASATLALLLFIMVPVYGAIGGAVALLAGSLVFLAVEMFFVHQHLLKIRFSTEFLKPAGAVLLMSILLLFTRNCSFLLSVLVGGAFYISLLWTSHYISDYELHMIRKLRREKA